MLSEKAMKVLPPFSTSYVCEQGFSALAALKSKYRNRVDTEAELRIAVGTNIAHRFASLCNSKQLNLLINQNYLTGRISPTINVPSFPRPRLRVKRKRQNIAGMKMMIFRRSGTCLLAFAILFMVYLLVKIQLMTTIIKAFESIQIYSDYLPCDWRVHNIPRVMRSRAVLECGISSRIYYEEVALNTTPAVTTLESHDPCLAHLAQSTWCNDPGMRVPRLVHYVWFTRHTLSLYTFISVLSAVRHVRPCLVLFHADVIPEGPYWRALLQLVPNIVHVRSQRPRQIFGHVINVVEHSADVKRLQVLLEYGGIYLDTDEIVLKSLDHIRLYPVVMGLEIINWNFCNGMMLSEKNSTFLQLWLATYVDFDDSQWAQHSTRVPYLLYLQKPDLVHVVDSFFRPNHVDIGKFYRSGEIHQWDDLLALHLYVRFHLKFFAEGQSAIQTNCTMGEILRYSLYGARDACQLTTLIN